VSELALGTWGLSGDGYGPVHEHDMERTVDRAVGIGITLFDTADVYGGGAMERLLGRRLPVNKTTVVTKLGTALGEGYPEKRFDGPTLYEAFDRSQERLRRDPVDVVLLHHPSLATMKKDEPFEVLSDLERRGRIRAWGVAAGSAAVAEKAIERGAKVLEMAYNCFFYQEVQDLALALRENGVGLLARSVLSYGLLTGHWSLEREFYPGDHRFERWNPDELKRRIAQVDALRAVVGGPAPTPRSVAIRFALELAQASSVVLGPRNTVQLDQCVREAGRMPPYLAPVTLDKLYAELAARGVTGE
jgi:aryl-alcohol dehydrogenase-like predicted oxidoreductase